MRQIIRRTVLILLLLALGSGVLASRIALIVAEDGELPSYGDEVTVETADLWRRFFDGAPAAELMMEMSSRQYLAGYYADDYVTADRMELLALLQQGQGNYENALLAYSTLMNRQPGRPENLVWLERMALIAGEFADGYRYLESRCEDYLADNEQNAELRFAAQRILIDLARRDNDPVQATELAQSSGYLSRFSYLGPFDNASEVGYDTAYGPETNGSVDFNATYDGKRRSVSWREYPLPGFTLADGEVLEPFYGSIRLSAITRPSSQVCGYVASWIQVDEPRDVVLHLGSVGAYKVWIDGEEVLAKDVYRVWAYPDTDAVGLTLDAGWHEVLIKSCVLTGGWEMFVRTTTPEGEPLVLEHRATPPEGWRRPSDAVKPWDPLPDNYLQIELMALAGNPLAMYYLGSLESVQRRGDSEDQLVREYFAEVIRALPNWVPALYEYGLYETNFNLAKAAWLTTLEIDPEQVESAIGLADSYTQLQRPREVLDYCEQGLATNPDCAQLLWMQARQLGELEYQFEREAVLDHLLEVNPTYAPGLRSLASYYIKRNSAGERERIYRDLLTADALDDAALGSLREILLDQGRVDAALLLNESVCPLIPWTLWPLRQNAELYADHARYAEAIVVIDDALAICPEDADMLALRGVCYHELGDNLRAEADWELALIIQPNLTWVGEYQRAVASVSAEERFDLPYAHDVYQLIDDCEQLDEDTNAEYLLDQQIVRLKADGTTTAVTHKVIRIIKREAIEDFGYGFFSYVPGEQEYDVRHMRVIREDGTELEATQFGEYSASSADSRLYHDEMTRYAPLPGLEEGCVIDIEYQLDDVGENVFDGHFSQNFLFGNYQPTHNAEFVLITPAGYDLYYHGMSGVPEPEITHEGSETVYRWTMTAVPRIEKEPYMPPLVENVPLLMTSSFSTWKEMGRWWWNLSKNRLVTTPRLRELAESLTVGAETKIEKLRAIYDYVISDIRYVALLLGIGGWQPMEPEQTVNTGYGDCKATAALMVSLFNAVDIESYPVFVRTRDRGELDWEQPGIGLFNHMICAVPLQDGIGWEEFAGKLTLNDEAGYDEYLFLDGTADYHAWWELPPNDQDVNIYICTPDGGHFSRSPLYTPESNFLESRTDLVLDKSGNASGHRELDYGAATSPQRRYDYQQAERQELNLERYWNNRYPGSDIFDIGISNLANMNDNVHFAYDLAIPSLAASQDDVLLFASHLHQDLLAQRFGSLSSRDYPLWMDKRWSTESTTTFQLPTGWEPLSLPDNVSETVTDSSGNIIATFEGRFSFTDGVVTVYDKITVDVTEVAVEDYSAFRALLAAYDRLQSNIITVGQF